MASIETAQYLIKNMIKTAEYDYTVNELKPIKKLLVSWQKATENQTAYIQLVKSVETMTHETEVIDWLRENKFEKHLEEEQLYTMGRIIDRAERLYNKLTLNTLKTIYPLNGFFSYEALETTTKPRYEHHYRITAKPLVNNTGTVYLNVSKIVYEALASQHNYMTLARSENHINTQWTQGGDICKHLSFALYGVYDGLEIWGDHYILD